MGFLRCWKNNGMCKNFMVLSFFYVSCVFVSVLFRVQHSICFLSMMVLNSVQTPFVNLSCNIWYLHLLCHSCGGFDSSG